MTGSTFTSIYRPETDTHINILAYEAAERQAASTFKRRGQYANRVMEVLYLSEWSASVRGDYCDLWDTHGLGSSIASQYCN